MISTLRRSATGAICVLALAGCDKPSDLPDGDWRAGVPEVRMAVRAADDNPEAARRWRVYKALIERATGLPVKVYQSSDFNGTIQALASDQVDVATLAGGGYANVEAQVGPLVAPILTTREAEGGTGYYSALMVRADSPFHSLADLKGRSIGYVDFNSTSGYLLPRSEMRRQGIDPDTFFGKSTFAGGHTQAVMALENGQFDAMIVQASGGTPETGFTKGALYTMSRRGLVDVRDFRTIWTAGPMPNSAIVVRSDRPQPLIDIVRGAMATLPYDDPELWNEIGQLDGSTFAAVDRSHYETTIALRKEDLAERRGGRP